MISDLTLIKLFFSGADVYQNYSPFIRTEALSREAQMILKDIGAFYGQFTDQEQIDPDRFVTWFNQVQHPELTETQSQLYAELFRRVSEQELEQHDEFIQGILSHFKTEEFKGKITSYLEKKDWDPEVLKELIETYQKEVQIDAMGEYEENSLGAMLAKETRHEGLQWRLNCLKRSIGPIIAGDFGVVAAYVETGKSSWLASEVAHFAHQVTDGDILWFNNEQTNDRVQKRIWCAALGVSESVLASDPALYTQMYTQYMHGDINRVKVFDCYDMSVNDIRKKMDKYNPKLVIIDMIDHLKGGGDDKNADWRRLQKLYYETRRLARVCPVLGASQCNSSVTWMDYETQTTKFQHYISMKQLAGSGQGKQEAMDFMITIGKDEAYPKTRYLHVCKNKLPGDGNSQNRYIKSECVFDEQTAQYTDGNY
jgi:replicative DNA helicase